MDIERVYLSKLAVAGAVERAISAGVRDTHFEDETMQSIYSYMGDHTRKYKGPPSMEVLRERFPNFNFEFSQDSVEYLQSRFITHAKQRYARQTLFSIAELLKDPEKVDDIDGIFLSEARRLAQLIPTTSVHRFSDIEDRIEAYEKGTSHVGIRMGIPQFDKLTLGIQPHEFVTIAGWQGLGKSTLTQWILFNAYMQSKTVMIISLEMEAQALLRKWDTMLTHFDYRSLKAHELSENDMELWRTKAAEVKNRDCDIIVKDDVQNCTPDFVYAEATRYQPDLLAVDYISLMDTSRSSGSQMWEKVTYITQQLKQVARTSGIPIIGVAQTNIASADGGAKLDNISYSRSIGQDSDIVLGLHQDEEMRENQQMTVRMLKNRDGSTASADLRWDMETMSFAPWNEVEFFMNRQKRKELVNKETGEIIDV